MPYIPLSSLNNMCYIYIIVAILLMGCDRKECKNTNPAFDNHTIESMEYKQELIKQIEIQGKENLEYWIADYVLKGDKEYMLVWIQNDKLCAQAMLNITGNKQMESFRKVKGKSYSGAQLSGLEYNIVTNADNIEYVFTGVKRIID